MVGPGFDPLVLEEGGGVERRGRRGEKKESRFIMIISLCRSVCNIERKKKPLSKLICSLHELINHSLSCLNLRALRDSNPLLHNWDRA